MRMRELAAAADLPRTTIHHYLREGLLPEPVRTAANAARYGPEHLERLELLKALRGPELGPLTIEEIREVLRLVERGASPAEAVGLASLGRRGARSLERGGDGEPYDSEPAVGLREAARRKGRELRELRDLVDAGLLVPSAGRARDELGAADLAALDACSLLIDEGIEAKNLAPLADLLREVKRYEEVLERFATRAVAESESEAVRRRLRRAFRDLHVYLLARPSVP